MRERRTWGSRITAALISAMTAGTMLVAASPARAGGPPPYDWTTTLTNEWVNNAAYGPDGTLYVATTNYGTPKSAMLRAYAPDGSPVWTRTYLPPNVGRSQGFDVAVAPDRSIYLLAYTYVKAQKLFQLSLVKYSPKGKVLWARNQKRINPYGIAVNKKAIVVVGSRGANPKTGRDAYVRSFTPKGAVSWTRFIDAGAKKNDLAWDVALAGDGTIDVVGEATLKASAPHDQSGALWRLSPTGTLKSSTYAKGSVAGSYDTWSGIARVGTKFLVGGDVNDTNTGSSAWESMVSGSKFVKPKALSWSAGYSRIWGVAAVGTNKLFETGYALGSNDAAWLVALDGQRNVLWTAVFDPGSTYDDGFGVAANQTQVAMVGATGNDGFITVYPS
jgi:hypothetical protein